MWQEHWAHIRKSARPEHRDHQAEELGLSSGGGMVRWHVELGLQPDAPSGMEAGTGGQDQSLKLVSFDGYSPVERKSVHAKGTEDRCGTD